ncbi:MAG: signal recognition particle-docking protein FtsY [Acidimicrobiales bacterium]
MSARPWAWTRLDRLEDKLSFRRRRAAPSEEREEIESPQVSVDEQTQEPPKSRPRIAQRFGRTRNAVAAPFTRLRSRGRLDESAFQDLEEALLVADVGRTSTGAILESLREEVKAGQIRGGVDELEGALRKAIAERFGAEDRSLTIGDVQPSVWLFVGVNGVGKTTTIGKVARRLQEEAVDVVVAAADTFRAAATEQLETWAQRSGAAFVRGAEGADPSSVVYDAIEHASARGAQVVLADSAGRLHTKVNLMEELRKIRRVADRTPGRVSEVLLVLDATTGQNGLVQAREFTNAVDVTGIVLTKLDGTAKGGVALAIHDELKLPIKLVGVGEGEDDLIDFDPVDFAAALIAD